MIHIALMKIFANMDDLEDRAFNLTVFLKLSGMKIWPERVESTFSHNTLHTPAAKSMPFPGYQENSARTQEYLFGAGRLPIKSYPER